MAQPGKEIVNGGDDERGAVAVLDVGGMDFGCDQQAGCVGEDVTLAQIRRGGGRQDGDAGAAGDKVALLDTPRLSCPISHAAANHLRNSVRVR
jgi:hypothetical protein